MTIAHIVMAQPASQWNDRTRAARFSTPGLMPVHATYRTLLALFCGPAMKAGVVHRPGSRLLIPKDGDEHINHTR